MHKAGILKGMKTLENSRALEVRVAVLQVTNRLKKNERIFVEKKFDAKNKNNPILDKK